MILLEMAALGHGYIIYLKAVTLQRPSTRSWVDAGTLRINVPRIIRITPRMNFA